MTAGALAACGGGGGQAAAADPPKSFATLVAPAGFAPATASLKSVRVSADALTVGGPMPAGYADPAVYTWVALYYVDGSGVARTLAVLSWNALARMGSTGLRLELPSEVAALGFDVYNANGAKSGSVTI